MGHRDDLPAFETMLEEPAQKHINPKGNRRNKPELVVHEHNAQQTGVSHLEHDIGHKIRLSTPDHHLHIFKHHESAKGDQ